MKASPLTELHLLAIPNEDIKLAMRALDAFLRGDSAPVEGSPESDELLSALVRLAQHGSRTALPDSTLTSIGRAALSILLQHLVAVAETRSAASKV